MRLYEAKYPKDCECLKKDKDQLFTHVTHFELVQGELGLRNVSDIKYFEKLGVLMNSKHNI